MVRNHAVFIAALLGLSGLSATGKAQECDEDTDCARGSWCVWSGGAAGGGSTGSDSSEPGIAVSDPAQGAAGGERPPVCDGPDCPTTNPEPSTGSCEPLPKGLCVDQAGCSPGLECVIPTYPVACAEPADAPQDAGAATTDGTITKQSDCTGAGEPAPYGYCQLPVTVCTTDAQCLPGLKCVESGSTGSDPGGATDVACADGEDCVAVEEMPPEPQPKQTPESTCEVAFTDCSAGQQCEAGYECVEEEVSCSSSGSSGTGGGSVGSEGTTDPGVPTPAAQKQRDPNCDYASSCYPAYKACTSDVDCSNGWVCTELPEGLPSWNQTGPVKTCLPRGLALAAEAGGGPGRGGVAASDSGEATGAPQAAGDDKAAEIKDVGGTSCSVGFGPRGENAAWLLLALGFIARKRKQAA